MSREATSSTLNFENLREAVSLLSADRVTLASLFDAALTSRGAGDGASQPASFIDGVVRGQAIAKANGADSDPTNTRHALALALLSVGDAQFAYEFLINAFLRGFANPLDQSAETTNSGLADLLKRLPGLLFSEQDLNIELQRRTSSNASFENPEAIINYVAKAQKRICRVVATPSAGPSEMGSGFLIGPSCVLTNWHVVEKLTEQRLADGEKLTVEFDFSQTKPSAPRSENLYAAHDDWLIAHSETGIKQPSRAGSCRTLNDGVVTADWWMNDICRQNWCNALDGSLDFAVIRLKGSPGARRRYYDLWPSTEKEVGDVECFVMHHANAQGQAFNSGRTFAGLSHGSRLFHSASTECGSSGGLLFDMSSGRPIGLHYGALGDRVPADQKPEVPECNVNVAVSLAAIAAAIEAQNKREAIGLASELVLPGSCLSNDDPVFGRGDLLAELTQMRSGARQILWIEVPCDLNRNPLVNYGRSYSTRIIETLFPEPANLHIKISAAHVPPNANTLFRLLAERIVGDRVTADALDIPEKETATEAYDKVLFVELAKLVRQYRKRSTIWLTLDDLDAHDLPDTDSRKFLERLYNQIATIPQLRIVLIGLKFQLLSIDEGKLAHNTIDHHDLPALERDLRKWLDEKTAVPGPMLPMARDVVAALAISGVKSGDAMRQLHVYVRDKLSPVLNGYFAGR